MSSLISWVTDIASINIATIGGTDITLGLIVAFSLIMNLAVSVLRRFRRM